MKRLRALFLLPKNQFLIKIYKKMIFWLTFLNNGKYLGNVNNSGQVIDENRNIIGCVASKGAVLSEQGLYIGNVIANKYVFDLNGKFLNTTNFRGQAEIYGQGVATLTPSNIVINDNSEIIGYAFDPNTPISNGNIGNIGIQKLFQSVYDTVKLLKLFCRILQIGINLF